MTQKIYSYSSWGFWKKFLVPLTQSRGPLVWGVVRSLFFGLQGGALARAMNHMVNALVIPDFSLFIRYVIVMVCVMSLTIFPNYFFRNQNERLFRGLQAYFYNTYISRYFRIDNNRADAHGTGFYNNVIQKGGDNWSSLLSNINGMGLQVVLRIITALLLVVWATGRVGFVMMGCIFVGSFLITQYGNRKMVVLRQSIRDYFTFADKHIIKMIMSKFEVLSNNRIQEELSYLSDIFDTVMNNKFKESKMKILTFDIQKGAIVAAQLLLVVYVGYEVSQGRIEVGTLAMVWMLSNQINGSVQDLNEYINDFYARIIYVEKLRDNFDDVDMVMGYDGGSEFTYQRGDIVLHKVGYDYGKGEVLHGLSLSIAGGKKTAFVGISGSGKSTIMKLLAGYIHPHSGTISIDGQFLPSPDVTDYVSLQSYYQHIGYLSQEPNVFDGTIYDNLVYGLAGREVSDLEINQVIQRAQCQFVWNFPDQLQTHIGEKGVRLSGGQRQRLAIAKVMLKNPTLIFLDEPTSALDSFSEEEVTIALENLFVDKTVIVIAHRLQTVKKADHIVVLDNGSVVEEGNHDALVQKKGQYAKMLELQSGF